jgi:putative ABC transport system permease protein
MRQFFSDAWQETRMARGGRAGSGFYARSLWNLAANAFVAWFDTPAFVAGRSWRRTDESWSEGSTEAGRRASAADLGLVFRQACRSLFRSPAFAVVATVTLALGIGATTAVFGAVNGVLLTALPYPGVDRLVTLEEQSPGPALRASWVAEETFRDWQQRARLVRRTAAWRLALVTLTKGGVPERLEGYAVSSGYFDVMGIPMTMGRGFTAEEDRSGSAKVVVLSHALWQRRFGSDPGVVGSVVTIDRSPHTIIGVAGRRLEFPERAEFWLPLALEFPPGGRAFRYLGVVARLERGSSLDEARADLERVATEIAGEHPDTNAGWGVALRPLRAEITGALRPFLVGGFLAVALLLMVAVANVTNLFIARMADRQEELAIRRALGAGPARLLHLFLGEALLVSSAGGAAGVALAYWGTRALGLAIQDRLPNVDAIAMDGRVLAFALLVTLAIGLVLGVLPAVLAPRLPIGDSLRAGMRTLVGHARIRRLRSGLLTAQVGLAVVLLVGTALLVRSLHHLNHVDPGFDPRHVVTFEVDLPDGAYDENRRVVAIDRLRSALGAVPGVEAVGSVFPMPMILGSVPSRLATPEMRDRPASQRPMAHSRVVSPGYFEAMRIPLVRGRFVSDDDRQGRLPVAVINQTLASRVFGDRDAIGQRITFQEPGLPDAQWLTVVGIVGDVRFHHLWSDLEPEVYRPVMQDPFSSARFVVRTRAEPDGLIPALATAVRTVDAELPMADPRTAEMIVREGLAMSQLTTALLALFAGASAVLALIGVLGVLTVVVNRQVHEMSVRMVLGASPRRVLGLVMSRGMAPVALGTALGLAGAAGATRLVAAQIHGIPVLDPWAYAIAAVGFLLASVLVCLWPAARAARINPATVIRNE